MVRYITIVAFILLLISPLVAKFKGHHIEVNEKRKFVKRPMLSFAALINNQFFSKYDVFINEHFPLRGVAIKSKNWLDINLFKVSPVKKAFIGEDGWLYFSETLKDYLKNACTEKEKVEEIAKKIQAIESTLLKSGRQFIFTVAPNKSTIYPEYVGLVQWNTCGKSRYDLLVEALTKYPVKGFIRLDPLLRNAKKQDLVYFKIDTHWNFEGAMIATRALLAKLEPRHWRSYLPNFEKREKKDWGDLARMVGLPKTQEVTYSTGIILPTTVDFSAKKLESGAKHIRTTFIKETEHELFPPVIIFGDSFMRGLFPLISSSFEKADFFQTIDMKDPEVIEAMDRASIVVLEVVERHLIGLLELKNL